MLKISLLFKKNTHFTGESGPPEQGRQRGVYPAPKFSDNVPFFSKSPLNMPFLKILNLK